jgi:hypothetical protein
MRLERGTGRRRQRRSARGQMSTERTDTMNLIARDDLRHARGTIPRGLWLMTASSAGACDRGQNDIARPHSSTSGQTPISRSALIGGLAGQELQRGGRDRGPDPLARRPLHLRGGSEPGDGLEHGAQVRGAGPGGGHPAGRRAHQPRPLGPTAAGVVPGADQHRAATPPLQRDRALPPAHRADADLALAAAGG